MGVFVFFCYFSTTNSTASVKDEKGGDKMEVEVYNYGKAEVLRDGYEGAKSENSANQKSKKKIIQ